MGHYVWLPLSTLDLVEQRVLVLCVLGVDLPELVTTRQSIFLSWDILGGVWYFLGL
jgi:hypothetical protein